MADLVLNFKYNGAVVQKLTLQNWNVDRDKMFYVFKTNTTSMQTDIKNILLEKITPSIGLVNLGLRLSGWLSTQYLVTSGFIEDIDAGERDVTITDGNIKISRLGLIFFREGESDFDVEGHYSTVKFVSQTQSYGSNSVEYQLSNQLTHGKNFVANCPVRGDAGTAFDNIINYKTVSATEYVYDLAGATQVEPIEISQTLENCTCDTQKVDVGETALITLTANDGYVFSQDNAPSITVNGVAKSFLLHYGNKTATVSYTANAGDVVEVNATAMEVSLPPEQITIATDLNNCTLNVETVEVGSSVTLSLTPISGYCFKVQPLLTVNGENIQFTVINDGLNAFIEYEAKSGDVVSVSANAVAIDVPPSEKVAKVVTYLTNVVMSPVITEFREGESVKITLTITEEYKWKSTPIFSTNAFDGSYESSYFNKVNDTTYEYTIPSTPFHNLIQNPVIQIIADALPLTTVSDKYGIVTLFKPSASDLVELSQKRFVDLSQNNVIDLGQYITSLKSIPYDVATTRSGDIILGKNDTDITAPIVDNDEITLDLGVVEVAGQYGNALDYEGVEVELILPYIGSVPLDVAKCLNKSIQVKYRINLISGDCVAMVYLKSEVGDVLLTTANGVIGFEIPYILKSDTSEVLQNANGEILFNEPPCLNIYQNLKASGDISVYTTQFIDIVGNLNGYNKASRVISVNNTGVIFAEEMQEIISLLTGGIII